MTGRTPINPKVLLPLGGLALVTFSAIAIAVAVGYTPETGRGGAPAAPVTETSKPPLQPPPPPIMLPGAQVPCMGWTAQTPPADGCAQSPAPGSEQPPAPTTPAPMPTPIAVPPQR